MQLFFCSQGLQRLSKTSFQMRMKACIYPQNCATRLCNSIERFMKKQWECHLVIVLSLICLRPRNLNRIKSFSSFYHKYFTEFWNFMSWRRRCWKKAKWNFTIFLELFLVSLYRNTIWNGEIAILIAKLYGSCVEFYNRQNSVTSKLLQKNFNTKLFPGSINIAINLMEIKTLVYFLNLSQISHPG